MNKLLQGHDKILSKSSSLKNIISQLENHLVLYILFYSSLWVMEWTQIIYKWAGKNLKKTFRKFKIKTLQEYFHEFMLPGNVFVYLQTLAFVFISIDIRNNNSDMISFLLLKNNINLTLMNT